MIIRNLCTNPSFETGTTSWVGSSAALDRINRGSMQGAAGSTIARATAIGSTTSFAIESTDILIQPGRWYAIRAWAAVDVTLEALLQAAVLRSTGTRSYHSSGWLISSRSRWPAGRLRSGSHGGPPRRTSRRPTGRCHGNAGGWRVRRSP